MPLCLGSLVLRLRRRLRVLSHLVIGITLSGCACSGLVLRRQPLDFYQIGASFSPLQVNPPSLLLLPLLRYLLLLSLSLILFLLPLSPWDLLRLLRLRLLVL